MNRQVNINPSDFSRDFYLDLYLNLSHNIRVRSEVVMKKVIANQTRRIPGVVKEEFEKGQIFEQLRRFWFNGENWIVIKDEKGKIQDAPETFFDDLN